MRLEATLRAVATLDQLPADRRAIIELVLRRGRSYAQLSKLLEMPEPRVREHAREALAALAPRSADRVDRHWRDQVADYLLGQQTGPEAKATGAHLRGSEAARTWALSVLDSVGHLYSAGAEPKVPERGGRRADAGGARAARAPEPTAATASARDRAPLSGRLTAPQRRRLAAGAAALAVVAGLVLLATQVLGGDDDPATATDGTEATAAAAPQVVAQLVLRPVGDGQGAGGAIIAERAGQPVMLMQAKLPRIAGDQAYVVWLYNDPRNAVAVAVPQVDRRGNLRALAPLPAEFTRFRFIDVSLQKRSDRTRHSGNSLLRAPLELAPATGGIP
jgi:hypothetical protein